MNQGRKASFIAACIMISLISIFAIEACYDKVQASSFLLDKGAAKVVLLLVDGISIEDFRADSYLNHFFDNSYSAFISARQTGKATPERAKLAIGAGKRLELGSSMAAAFQQQKGIQVPQAENIKRLNEEEGFSTYVGYLGGMLHQKGRSTGLLGNSDTDRINRSAAMLEMDNKVLIDFGEIDRCTINDASFPGGRRTDYEGLLKLYEKYKAVDLLTMDLGDLQRLDQYQALLSPESFQAEKAKSISRISRFIQEISVNI